MKVSSDGGGASGPARRARRVLVTGAGGFIGSHVCEVLLHRGDTVVGVEAFTDSYARADKERNLAALSRHPAFELRELDLREAPLAEVLRGVDAVVNEAALAGLPRSWSDVAEYVTCNVLALARLVEACEAAGIERFVQASTSSVYGRNAVGDESLPTQPVSPYGVSKLAAEELLQAYVTERGFPAVILRYFSVFGPRQRPDMAYRIFTDRLMHGLPVVVHGDGRQSRSNTHVRDVAEATVRALDVGEPGDVMNIGGAEEIELLDAIDVIAGALDVRARVVTAPARPGDQRRTRADTTHAREVLGWRPVIGISAGLRDQVRWHVETFGTDVGAGEGPRLLIDLTDEALAAEAAESVPTPATAQGD